MEMYVFCIHTPFYMFYNGFRFIRFVKFNVFIYTFVLVMLLFTLLFWVTNTVGKERACTLALTLHQLLSPIFSLKFITENRRYVSTL